VPRSTLACVDIDPETIDPSYPSMPVPCAVIRLDSVFGSLIASDRRREALQLIEVATYDSNRFREQKRSRDWTNR